jgi:hypothetical protein
MNCARTRRFLPGLLDGEVAANDREQAQSHLTACPACRHEMDRYRRMASLMAGTERPAVPANLATQIRLRLAAERRAEPWYERAWSRVVLTTQNLLAPLAVPATGGAVTSVLTFMLLAQSLLFGVPLGAVANDVPVQPIRPAGIHRLAPFSVAGIDEHGCFVEDDLIAEVVVDAQGQAVNYSILAGPDNRNTRRQLDQVVFFSRYRPQMNFGRPAAGGRVVLSFREVRVKG